MAQDNSIDPRIVANAVVSYGQLIHLPISHVALQKLVYFAHGLFLTRHRVPLVQGYFEAWKYGPVHPAVYRAFKVNGKHPITSLVGRVDLRTGQVKPLPELTDALAWKTIRHTVEAHADLTPFQLVELSHASEGPWHVIYKQAEERSLLSLRISNDLIQERFKFHKRLSNTMKVEGDLDEDAPLAHYGIGEHYNASTAPPI